MRRSVIVAAAEDVAARLRSRPLWRVLLAVAIGIILGGTAAVWVFPHQALAATTCSAPGTSPHYNDVVGPNDSHYGVRVFSPGMQVYNITPVCIHISSLEALGSNGNFVEVGWQDILNNYTFVSSNCSITGSGTPHVFRTRLVNNTFYCTNYGSVAVGSYGFALDDQNGDDSWTYYFNGSTLGSNPVSADFAFSAPLTNAERYENPNAPPSESAKAIFNGLQYMPLNGSWTDWRSAGCVHNGDPVYKNQIISVTEVAVANGPQQC